MPWMSIVVPVFKVKESYLRVCIDSLVNQTFKDIEIILVDDGSPDNCGMICDEYAVKDNRVIVVHQENKGVSCARNTGLDHVTGKWVTFVDADDWIDLDMCELIEYDICIEDGIEILLFSGSNEYIDHSEPFQSAFSEGEEADRKQRLESVADKIMLEKAIFYCADNALRIPIDVVNCTCCKAYSVELLRTNGIRYSEGIIFSEDSLFSFQCIEAAKRMLFVNRRLYHYRKRSDSVGNKFCSNCDMEWEKTFKKFRHLLDQSGRHAELDNAYHYRALYEAKMIIRQQYYHSANCISPVRRWRLSNALFQREPFHEALRVAKGGAAKQRLMVLLFRMKLYPLCAAYLNAKKSLRRKRQYI